MNDFWQENKRLVTQVGVGLLVFLIGWLTIDSIYGARAVGQERTVASLKRKLESARYSVGDRDAAEAENQALLRALASLGDRAVFRPRPEFSVPEGADAGAASRQYTVAVERVREDLAEAAGRKRILLPQGLDLEMVVSVAPDEFERHLAALDFLERVVSLAIRHDVKQLKGIKITLDPGFRGRGGVGPIEETTIEMEATSTPATITAWLQATQTPAIGQVLPIASIEGRAKSAKVDEMRVKIAFSVVRLHLDEELAESLEAAAGDPSGVE
jgi:hypothetical protein